MLTMIEKYVAGVTLLSYGMLSRIAPEISVDRSKRHRSREFLVSDLIQIVLSDATAALLERPNSEFSTERERLHGMIILLGKTTRKNVN